MKAWIVHMHWLLATQVGIDPRRMLRGLVALPRYLRDRRRYRAMASGPIGWRPCLHDRDHEGGEARSEYFLQDLEVARRIHATAPRRVLDVGSRVDGFVAHVAAFRTIEVIDVRPLPAGIAGVVFHQADISNITAVRAHFGLDGGPGYADAVTCLHVIEHVGLGRYGDPLDPDGPARALETLAALVVPRGRLYLSTPVGRPRVEFNANRVFDPEALVAMARAHGLRADRLTVIGTGGRIDEVVVSQETFRELAAQPYHLGMFEFVREGGV